MLSGDGDQFVVAGVLQMTQDFCQLVAEERRHDYRRSLMTTQTVCVCGAHDRSLQQTVVLVNRHQGFHDERHEAQVVLRGLARSVQQHAGIGSQ